MSILVFLLILSVLVIVHELGHFLVAKWHGVKVEEFGLGYPPRAATLFTDKAGTEYTLNWLPFGGFVRLFGEDGEETGGNQEVQFVSKIAWKKMMIVLAGALVNFVFGVIVFGFIYTNVGIPTNLGHIKIGAVVPGSPADKAGLMVGDEVVAVEIQKIRIPITKSEDFIQALLGVRGQTVVLELQNGKAVPVYVRTEAETPTDQGATGVAVVDSDLKQFPFWQMPFRGIAHGTVAAVEFGRDILQSLGKMVTDFLTLGKVPQEVAGPVGIAYAVQKQNLFASGWRGILYFAAILSVNLAIVNVLPLPALDGGRAVFILYEMITGKRVKSTFENAVNSAGMVMLLALIFLISARDLRRVIEDPGVREWVGTVLKR